jgi:hypothetical protein
MSHIKYALGAALLAAATPGCSSSSSSGPLGNVESIVILQRQPRNDQGDVFDYTDYVAGARLVKLSPPTAAGKLTTLCCDQAGPDFANIDIQSYDISFDASQIVFAGKLSSNTTYGIFMLTLANGSVQQIATDPMYDYINPVFLPGNQIFLLTNNVDSGFLQHQDEYERGITSQVATMNIDGTNFQFGTQNLSHRSHPVLTSDGRLMFTNWDHLGTENAGHPMFMNQDGTAAREAFGKEGDSPANSELKAQEIAPGRFVMIATSRDRTLQSGALFDVRLGIPYKDSNGLYRADQMMSEANATYVNWTPDVPLDRTPSSDTIGRYYDAYPLGQQEFPSLLVSWADGPVESSTLAAAGVNAQFGVYVYDTQSQQREPLFNDPNYWNINPRPLETRTAPPVTGSQIDSTLAQGQALMGAMNVYTSTLHTFSTAPYAVGEKGEIFGVRLMEGFSSEEGFPRMFGTSMFEGQANLGVARVASDGSWLAKVPSNVPIHLEAVDVYGMSLFAEPIWISGRTGESRVCGGCHENRAVTTVIDPGVTQAFELGPLDAMSTIPRPNRCFGGVCPTSAGQLATTPDQIVGVAWDKQVQPIFDAKCVSCHNGTPGPANPSYTITNPTTGAATTWTFNLSSTLVTEDYGNGMVETFSASYFSMVGPDMEAITRGGLVISGNFAVYLNPQDAHGSTAIQMLNPSVLYPTACDASVAGNTCQRAFATAPHSTVGYTDGKELTPTQFYTLILAADMGANYFARENNPMNFQYQ